MSPLDYVTISFPFPWSFQYQQGVLSLGRGLQVVMGARRGSSQGVGALKSEKLPLKPDSATWLAFLQPLVLTCEMEICKSLWDGIWHRAKLGTCEP